MSDRPLALVTGVGRRAGIAAAIAVRLAEQGWDLHLSCWSAYDERLGMVRGRHDPEDVVDQCREHGVEVELEEADLADPAVPARLVASAAARGHLVGLALCHCEGVDAGLLDADVESWDRHFAVNARASWLLVQEFGRQLPRVDVGEAPARVVALTSNVDAGNLPYGASKAALDRIVVAAAHELGDRGVRANVINPGPIDTGWMNDEIRAAVLDRTPAGRLGSPADTADLVGFLFSGAGSWINGQLLGSNGGFR